MQSVLNIPEKRSVVSRHNIRQIDSSVGKPKISEWARLNRQSRLDVMRNYNFHPTIALQYSVISTGVTFNYDWPLACHFHDGWGNDALRTIGQRVSARVE